MKSLLFWGVTLLAAGEAASKIDPSSFIGLISQTGGVGVLAWVAWSQRQELRDLRDRHAEVIDKLCDRMDKHEQTRHDDAAAMSAVLRELTARIRN
jgi:hypothetical protein